MDVVYTIGRAPSHEELRYSLRSLANLEGVDQVWIVGAIPRWATGVERLVTRQNKDKYHNTSHNIRRALETREVSDPFILFNDDFFALRPVEHQDYDRGTVAAYLTDDRKRGGYRDAALAAYQVMVDLGFEDPLNFDMHLPLTVHKKLMAYALKANHDRGWKRSVYGNIALAEGAITTSTRDDVKIQDNSAVPEGTDWVSTTNRSFDTMAVGQAIRELFPEASRYE